MELVVLGLKDKYDGSLYIYDVVSRPHQRIPVKVNQILPSCPVAPFPFNSFSSLNYGESVFETHDPTYLRVHADLSPEEWQGMHSGSIFSCQFANKAVTILGEYHQPFAYALKQLNVHGERLGTHDLTTWVIHEAARTPDEHQAMCDILDKSLAHHATTDHTLDLSVDRHVLTYLDHLLMFPPDSYTFGKYGRNTLTPEDMRTVPVSDKSLLVLLEKTNCASSLIHHPRFDKGFYQRHIEPNPTLEAHLIAYLDAEDLVQWQAVGFDMDYLFERYYHLAMAETMYENDAYRNVNELVQDSQYTPLTKTHDPYEYYCCPDCEGYEIDVDDEPYDYQVDEQVEALADLLHHWEAYLTKRSALLFDDWSEDIFKRYQSKYPLPAFLGVLAS